jgi:hypothetical protein
MRRTLALVIAALAILALPATALAADTRIDYKNEHVGLMVATGPTTWTVQDLDYKRIATVQKSNAKRYDFLREGKLVGSVRQLGGSRLWKVYKGESKNIGSVRQIGKQKAAVYHVGDDGDPIGLAEGTDPVAAAASVLFGFHGQTGVPKHDHSKHRH